MKKLLNILLIGLILAYGGYLYAGSSKTQSWNASFETIPGDSDNISEGAQRIRNLKRDIRERFSEDHYMDLAGTQADHGEHKKVTFQAPLTSDPTNVSNKGFLYTKDVSGKAELHWEDESGNVLKLTNQGTLPYAFPSGTALLFYQDTCPTGWTIATELYDRVAMITKGSGAGGLTGGTYSGDTWAITGLTANAHTHTTTIPKDGWTGAIQTPAGRLGYSVGAANGDTGLTQDRNLTSGTASATGVTSAGTWDIPAYNFIICVKQ